MGFSLDEQRSQGYDAFVTRWRQQGTTRTRDWSRLIGTSAEDEEARAVVLESDGDLVIGGTTRGAFPGILNAGTRDAFIARINLP